MYIRKHGNISITSPQPYESGGIHPYHHEILYISSGEIQLNWQDRVYVTKGPALFFLTPNTTHQLSKISPQCSFLYMEVDMQHDPFLSLPEIMQWNAMQSDMQSPFYSLSVIIQTMNQIRNHFESELVGQAGIIDQLISAEVQKVTLLVRQIVAAAVYSTELGIDGASKPSASRQEMDKLVEYVMHALECFYRENITLKFLADLVHLNPSYLIRIFKRSQGMTPFQYLTNIRMNAAVSHLQNSDLSIQDIVKLTGFQSIHYFSRAFKNTYGISPSQWRQKHR